jgi:hypothetical protein
MSDNLEVSQASHEINTSADNSAQNTDANNTADSSTADSNVAKQPIDLREAAIAALSKDNGEDSTTSEQDNVDPGEEPKPDELDAQEDSEGEEETTDGKDDRLDKNPRFKELARQKNEFKAKAEAYEQQVSQFKQEIEQLKPYAQDAVQLHSFLRENSIPNEEFAEAAQILALSKRDPSAALAKLIPHVQSLQRFTGELLPEDLAADVEQGAIDHKRATELAAYRHKMALLEQQQTNAYQQQQLEQQRQQAEYQQRSFKAMQDAVLSKVDHLKKSDPDFDKIINYAVSEAHVQYAQNPARTPGEAVAMFDQSYQKVSDDLRKMRAQPTPVRQPVSTTNLQTKGSAQPSMTPRERAMRSLQK